MPRVLTEPDPTGRCGNCGLFYEEHPGGFCPEKVWGDGTITVDPEHRSEFTPKETEETDDS